MPTPKEALRKLIAGNETYIKSSKNPADISGARIAETAKHGQTPYAAILTCSDSRVPPEHIFTAGLGELFVIRTAGNVAGDLEIGSMEFAVRNLSVPVAVIMGHTQCVAVAAALAEKPEGYRGSVLLEIQAGINGANEADAVRSNALNTKRRIVQSEIIKAAVESGRLLVVCAEYDINTGRVEFWDLGK